MSLQIANLKAAEGCFSYAWHPKLIQVYLWFCARYNNPTITCAYEHRSYPSVHSVIPLRGVDMRSRHHADPKLVETDVNDHWQYDPERPEKKSCIYHDTGRGPHFHLQVHPNTIKRKADGNKA